MGIFRRSKPAPEQTEPTGDDSTAPDTDLDEGPDAGPWPDPEAAQEPGDEGADRTVSVVIVDDDEDVRFVMSTALSRDGFDVLGSAGNAEEALALVEAEAKPDIILLDLHMPDVSGLELLPLLREHSPQSRFVVCSAITASYMLEATMDAGASGFIVKGVSAKSIAEHLHRVAGAGLAKIVRPYPLNRDY